jgi:hypothetical protein
VATSFNYTTLTQALIDMVEETSTDYADYLDTIIPLAEDKLLKDLDLEIFDISATSTFGIASPWLAKPSDMVALRTMHYTDGSGNFKLLEPKSWEYAKDFWPNVNTTTATPKYFVEYSDTNWFIAGTPASGLVTTIRYIKRPAGLTSGNPTTWLSQHVGDLLFFGCLVISEQFLKADARMPMWKQDYTERLAAAIFELKPDQRDNYMPMTQIPVKEQ